MQVLASVTRPPEDRPSGALVAAPDDAAEPDRDVVPVDAPLVVVPAEGRPPA
jgi:hypothetical protein